MGALRFKRERALGRPVAVAVGLYHRADCNLRANMLAHHAKIFAQRGQRNLGPGAAIEGERAEIGQD